MGGKTWMIALSQMFFSLSVLSTTMVVYGSYLKENDDIPLSATATAFGDTAVAVTAGSGLVFVILPPDIPKNAWRGYSMGCLQKINKLLTPGSVILGHFPSSFLILTTAV